VVDHEPDVADRARERWRGLTVVENVLEPGVSNARNAGVECAHGEIVAFLDDDAVADPTWLESLLAVYAETQAVGVGGRIEPIWISGRPAWFPDEFGWVVGCTYTGLPARRASVRNVIGTNMSFPRDVFAAVGGFDSRLGRVGSAPVGCDETEMCIRAGRRWPDRAIVYEPAARVAHKVPARRATWRYFLSRCYAEGRSKAVVAQVAGASSALSTERGYAARVLPAGALAALRDAWVNGNGAALGRAGAIVLGFAATALGFGAGWVEGARPEAR
jgi:GT2 family glycosyltransferase